MGGMADAIVPGGVIVLIVAAFQSFYGLIARSKLA
jgi:hypothetical protein